METNAPIIFKISVNFRDTTITASQADKVFWETSYNFCGAELVYGLLYYMRYEHHLLIGEPWAQRVLLEIGSALPLQPDRTMSIKGRNLITGRPDAIDLSSIELRELFHIPVNNFTRSIPLILNAPEKQTGKFVQLLPVPEFLAAKLGSTEIVLTGEYGFLKKLDERLERETGLKVVYVPEAT